MYTFFTSEISRQRRETLTHRAEQYRLTHPKRSRGRPHGDSRAGAVDPPTAA